MVTKKDDEGVGETGVEYALRSPAVWPDACPTACHTLTSTSFRWLSNACYVMPRCLPHLELICASTSFKKLSTCFWKGVLCAIYGNYAQNAVHLCHVTPGRCSPHPKGRVRKKMPFPVRLKSVLHANADLQSSKLYASPESCCVTWTRWCQAHLNLYPILFVSRQVQKI